MTTFRDPGRRRLPQVTGPGPSERDLLLAYLRKMRHAVVAAGEGLSDEQRRAPGVPSGTNLLGLVHHLTGVEEHWFQLVFLGERPRADKAMKAPPAMSWEQAVASYRSACARSDEIVRSTGDLSTLSAIPNPGEEQLDSLRSVVVHMIEETARHAGHADIIRELIDGRTSN